MHIVHFLYPRVRHPVTLHCLFAFVKLVVKIVAGMFEGHILFGHQRVPKILLQHALVSAENRAVIGRQSTPMQYNTPAHLPLQFSVLVLAIQRYRSVAPVLECIFIILRPKVNTAPAFVGLGLCVEVVERLAVACQFLARHVVAVGTRLHKHVDVVRVRPVKDRHAVFHARAHIALQC